VPLDYAIDFFAGQARRDIRPGVNRIEMEEVTMRSLRRLRSAISRFADSIQPLAGAVWQFRSGRLVFGQTWLVIFITISAPVSANGAIQSPVFDQPSIAVLNVQGQKSMTAATPVTDETTWLNLLADRTGWDPPCIPTLVISPHPDDETLGAGGLIASQCRRGAPVSIIAVSDGEAAYPEYPSLASVRSGEHTDAARTLGVGPGELLRLGLPDSDISRYEDELAEQIADQIGVGTLVVAPWVRDPHPDHEACGRAALKAARATGASIVFYLFWTWHRNTPESLSSLPLRRFRVPEDLQATRATALACHRSQLEHDNGEPILPECFLAPARRSFETFIVPGSSRR